MKKIKKYLILLLIIFLTGCSSYDMSMKIDKNRSMDFTITILSDGENSNITDNVTIYKEKLEKHGYSVSEYNQDNKYGMIITKHYEDIDDISHGKRDEEFNLLYFYNNEYSAEVEKKMFNLDKQFDTNRYAANFYVDLTGLNIDLNNATVTYNVYLPNGNFSNNANRSNEGGNHLVWNITSSGKTDIDFVFELRNYDTLYYGIAILIVVFLIFTIVSNLFGKNDNNKGSVSKPNNHDIEKKIENITKNAIAASAKKNDTKDVPNNMNKKPNLVPEANNMNNTNDTSMFENPKPVQNTELFEYPSTNDNQNVTNNNEQLPNPFGDSVKNETSNDSSSNNELFEVPVIGSNSIEEVKQEENIQKIDIINDVNSGHDSSSVDSFVYQKNEEKDENDLDSHIDDNFTESIIKVNNKDVVVNKKNDKEY